jgi:mannose/fructose-specific phosphotransferase system component IIA
VTTQPEALRLADLLGGDPNSKAQHIEAAAELRRLHSVNAELLEALEDLLQEYDVQMSAYQEMDVQRRARAAIAKAEEVKP